MAIPCFNTRLVLSSRCSSVSSRKECVASFQLPGDNSHAFIFPLLRCIYLGLQHYTLAHAIETQELFQRAAGHHRQAANEYQFIASSSQLLQKLGIGKVMDMVPDYLVVEGARVAAAAVIWQECGEGVCVDCGRARIVLIRGCIVSLHSDTNVVASCTL